MVLISATMNQKLVQSTLLEPLLQEFFGFVYARSSPGQIMNNICSGCQVCLRCGFPQFDEVPLKRDR
eukprot:1546119-Pyramimonas_sp.AAC.1